MREHTDSEDPNPDEGWVTGERLWDSEIASITLCRFSGIAVDGGCPARRQERHPDVDCEGLFVSIEALRAGTIDLTQFGEGTIRIPMGGGGDLSAEIDPAKQGGSS